ncbi:MAG: hypothetical protein N3A61_04875, partial [Ignavibacteria bacterium]|nr:hypothetical protein [Ignavibacteria bacterium]
ITSLLLNEDVLTNFEESFNEGGEVPLNYGILGKEIYPIKIGRRVTKIDRNFEKEVVGDSAKVRITTVFTGVLIIAGTYTQITPGDTTIRPDTVIFKPFVETVKRTAILKRVEKPTGKNRGWQIIAISLPEGQTSIKNIKITKMDLTLDAGNLITITNPNEFFFYFEKTKGREMPAMQTGKIINLKVYLTSKSNKDDLVTLNFGNNKLKGKRKLNLISSVPSGENFDKIYEGNFLIPPIHPMGRFHSVVNALTNETVFDDAGQVSSSTWGFPYYIK